MPPCKILLGMFLNQIIDYNILKMQTIFYKYFNHICVSFIIEYNINERYN